MGKVLANVRSVLVIPKRKYALAIRSFGLALALGLAQASHGHANGNDPANAPANISINFATGFVNYDFPHCYGQVRLEYRTSKGSADANPVQSALTPWTSAGTLPTATSDATVAALADAANDYVEVRMYATGNAPHCAGGNSPYTPTIAYRRTTLRYADTNTVYADRTIIHPNEVNNATLAVRLGSPTSTLTATVPNMNGSGTSLSFSGTTGIGGTLTAPWTSRSVTSNVVLLRLRLRNGVISDGAAIRVTVSKGGNTLVSEPLRVAVDYDADDNGLIEIRSLAQLNAIRWDLDGDGAVAAGDETNYGTAFPNAFANMGCPTTTADADDNDCRGYELENDLDFDTDDDGGTWTEPSGTFTADADDTYYDSGNGWDPIGADSTPNDTTHFNAIFDGKGHVIENLLVNRERHWSGLFAALRGDAVVRSLGLPNARVRRTFTYSGPLAAENWGRVAGVWSTGAVAGAAHVGGLIGNNRSGGVIVASYSTAAVDCDDSTDALAAAGGLTALNGGTITASYATGTVTGACPTAANKHGLAGGAGTFTASYWDRDSSGIADDGDVDPPEGESLVDMRTPTDYTGLYVTWDDVDVDGDGRAGLAQDADDDAWDFGTAYQHPVLKFGGFDTALQFRLQPFGFLFDADAVTAGVQSGPRWLNEAASSPTNSAGYTVRLRSPPIQDVTVEIASGDEAAVTVDDTDGNSANGVQNALLFTMANWDTAQTVTLTAQPDDDGKDNYVAITHVASTATASGWQGVSAELTAAVDDDETPAIVFSPAMLNVPEGASSTYAVRLATLPVGGAVTVTITGAADGISASPTRLEFTAQNWSMWRTVTVSAANDQNAAHETVALTHAAAGADYGGRRADFSVTATDDETASLRVNPTNLTVREGASAMYSIRLNAMPSAAVTVTVGGATAAATVDTDSQTPGGQMTLTFDTTNWNVDQAVTVSGTADDDGADATTTLTHSAAGASEYASLTLAARPGVYVTVTDSDRPGILIDADPSTANIDEPGPLTLNELSTHGDNAKDYTVRLATEPTSAVTVAITSDDGAVHVDTDITPRTRSLMFTTTNWATAQTVTATAPEDFDATNEQVTISHVSMGGEYNGATAQLLATTTDDDEPAIGVFATTLTGSGVLEGATETYTVRPQTEPAGTVTVAVTPSAGVSVDMDSEQAGVQHSLRFDATNWNRQRLVVVRGLEDDDGVTSQETIRHVASGADYDRAEAVTLEFGVHENDVADLLFDPSTLAVNEGATASYAVSLTTAPSSAVEVSLSSSDDAVATVTPRTMQFTASNWSSPQQALVAGTEDAGTTDATATITHTVSSSGVDYAGLSRTVTVNVRDDEAAGVYIEPPQIKLPEGASGSYRIRLNTQPSGDVEVQPTAATGSEDLQVENDGIARTFTMSNWNTEQTVRVTVGHDDDAEDETLNASNIVTGYAGVTTAPAFVVLVEDDEAPGLAFAPLGGVSVAESASPTSATYTTVLTAQPTGSVTVSVSSDDAGLVVDADDSMPGRQGSLAFSATNWDTARTVTVRAVADADAATEMVTLSHSATGGGYAGTTAEYQVRVTDIDAAPRPTQVVVSSAGPTSLAVRWRASAGAEIHFVQWRLAGEPWSEARLLEVPGGSTSARIDGLRTNARYGVRVLGVNRGDAGDPSAEAFGSPSASQQTGDNRAPQVANPPLAVVLETGGSASFDVHSAFVDPDGDALSHSAFSSDEAVVAARVENGVLLLGAGIAGVADVTLSATDPHGASAQTTVDVDVIGTVCATEPAQAPEGGTATAMAELTSPARTPTTVLWRIVADRDPATADADAGEHGDASGEVQIGVGERCAAIEIPILEDTDIEPAREWFALELQLRYPGSAQLAQRLVLVAVQEGVCDRTPPLAAALLAATGMNRCEQPASADLARVQHLRLAGLLPRALSAGDLGGLMGVRTLDLSANALRELPALSSMPRLERLLLAGNALVSVPTRALASPERLRDLDLSANALRELPANPFARLTGLRVLRLDGNELTALPDGLFAGLAALRLLRLDGNPGAPFALPVELERIDAEPWAPSPANLRVAVPFGAPFDMAVALSAQGGVFRDGVATAETVVSAGQTAGPRLSLSSASGFAQVSLAAPPFPSRLCLGQPCWRGFEFDIGEPLSLFVRPLGVLPAPEPAALFGDALRLPLASLVLPGDAEASGELAWRASSSNTAVATARIVDGHLLIEAAAGAEGVVVVEAVATDALGQTASVSFEVQVEFHWLPNRTRGWRGAIQSN